MSGHEASHQGERDRRAQWTVGYVGGSFDMFGIDHLSQLEAASERCDVLIAGVLTDELVLERSGVQPVIPFDERIEIIRFIKPVSVAVRQSSLFLSEVWENIRFDVAFVPHALEAAQTDYVELSALGVEIVPLPSGRASRSVIRQPTGDSRP